MNLISSGQSGKLLHLFFGCCISVYRAGGSYDPNTVLASLGELPATSGVPVRKIRRHSSTGRCHGSL